MRYNSYLKIYLPDRISCLFLAKFRFQVLILPLDDRLRTSCDLMYYQLVSLPDLPSYSIALKIVS